MATVESINNAMIAENAENAILKERNYTVEKELSKALVRFSYARVNVKQAKETANRMASVFEEEARKNVIVVHKGVN